MPTLTLGQGQRVVFEDTGKGSPIVLVHGSPGMARNWEPVARRLADRYRVLAPNLPGYGGSDPRPAGEPSTAQAAAVVEAVIREAGAPVLVAGHSYGGNVALAIALRGEVPVAGLVLLEPVLVRVLPAVGRQAEYAELKPVFDAYLEKVQGGDGEAVRLMVDYWFGPGAFDLLPDAVRQFLVAHAPVNAVDVRSSFAEDHSTAALGRLRVPVLAVYGGRSPAVSRAIATAIAAQVPNGTAHELPGATHALTTTHAAQVADLIAAHAARCLLPMLRRFPES